MLTAFLEGNHLLEDTLLHRKPFFHKAVGNGIRVDEADFQKMSDDILNGYPRHQIADLESSGFLASDSETGESSLKKFSCYHNEIPQKIEKYLGHPSLSSLLVAGLWAHNTNSPATKS